MYEEGERRHTESNARVPSFVRTLSLFHRFFLSLHFPSNLSVGRISAEVRALWMARVSSTPLFHSACSILLLFSFHVCFQTSASVSVQLLISNPNCHITVPFRIRVTGVHEKIPTNVDSSRNFADKENGETEANQRPWTFHGLDIFFRKRRFHLVCLRVIVRNTSERSGYASDSRRLLQ